MVICFSSGDVVAFKIGVLELVSFPAVVTVTVVATVVLFSSKEATPTLKKTAVH